MIYRGRCHSRFEYDINYTMAKRFNSLLAIMRAIL